MKFGRGFERAKRLIVQWPPASITSDGPLLHADWNDLPGPTFTQPSGSNVKIHVGVVETDFVKVFSETGDGRMGYK